MKTALITGATSGIGKATAELLAKQGFRLILCGRRTEVLDQLKMELSEHTEIFSLNFDQRYFNEVETAFESLPVDWKNIDILINNAGNAHGLDSLIDGNVDDWDMMIDGNVKGLLYVSKMVMPGMKERNEGHIVNISSVAARQTYANGVVYCASKKAVDIISDGTRTCYINNGHERLSHVTGTGCMATSLIGSFCGAVDDYYLASLSGVMAMGLAGELASESLSPAEGIGTFRIRLFDNISNLSQQMILKRGRVSYE